MAGRWDGTCADAVAEEARTVRRRACGCIEEYDWTLDDVASQQAYLTLMGFLAPAGQPTGGVPANAIMCFGSRDLHVPITAAELFHAGAAPLVVCTGGVALRAGRSEAIVFAAELVARGVPPDRIVVEQESAHTGDNVVYGMRVLQSRMPTEHVGSIIAVAWPFVARRCLATFASRYPDVAVRTVPAFCRSDRPAPFTRVTARWSVDQLDRLVHYAERGEIAAVTIPTAVAAAAAHLRGLLASGADRTGVHGLLEPVGELG